MKKKILSWLLVIAMVLGLFPTTAFAAEAPVSVTADDSAVEVTYQGTFGDKQYTGGYQIPVYYAKASETATLNITYSEDYFALGSDYYSVLDQGALTGVTKADLEAYFTTAVDYNLNTDNSVVYIEFADDYYATVFGLLIELEPASSETTTYTVTLPTGEGYTAEAYGESASPVEAGGSYSFTVTVDDDYDDANMKVMANDSELTADEGVYTIMDIQEDQTVTVTGVKPKIVLPVSVTADDSAVEVTYQGTFADKQYTGGYQIPVYYAKASETATLNITYSEDYFALGSDYYSVLDQGALTGVTKADLEAYFTTAVDYNLNTDNSVVYIEFADDYYATVFGLLIELEPASAGTTTYIVTLPTGEGYTAEAYGESASPVEAGGSYSFTVAVDDDYDDANMKVMANDSELTADEGVYTIMDIQEDQTVTVTGVKPKIVLPVSVTADDSAVEVTYQGTFGDKQYTGGYQIPVYYAKASETATLNITYSEDYFALGSDYYSVLDQGTLTGVTKADLEAYFTTAVDYNLNTDNSVVYIEFADDYYATVFGLLIELEPASSETTTYIVTLTTGEGYVAKATDGSASPVEAGGSYSFTVDLIYGYDATNMKVMANGSELTAEEGVYTIENISEDQTVTVTGVEKKTTEQTSDYITVSVEKYDADGNGSFLLNPKRLLKEDYTNDYVTNALRQAMGGTSMVNFKADTVYSVTGVYDSSQGDSYLDNGDLEGFQWQVLVNNETWNGIVFNAAYKLKGGDVIRCIYTNENEAGQTNKDALVQLAGEVSDEVKQKDAYKDALDTIVKRGASESDVKSAISALENAMIVNATSVEITAGESTELKVNQSVNLEATVLPANTTEELVWSSSDSSIVSVDAASGRMTGVSAGTAQVTATCGSVSDTIQVTVTAVEATDVTITNGNVSVEARFSVQLAATVKPEDSTELVVWSVGDENIATVNANGKLTGISAGTTTVTATAGSVSDTVNVTVSETTSPYVYFKYTDGRVQEMKDDAFTLTVLDEGSFVVGNTTASPKWDCSEYVSDGSGGYQYNYWISSDGKYQPHGVKEMTASVNAGGYYKTFTINTVSSEISQIKAYIGNQEMNAENSYSVTGTTAGVPVTVKGLNGDGEWVYIPTQALEITSSNTNIARILGNQMSLIHEGSAQITVSMVDNSNVSASFAAICNTVKVTGIDVTVPTEFVIDKWDNAINGYIGITQGYSDPDTEYYVVYTPSNATNQDLIWEDLTPEIAEFYETWSAGIVPKKAGTAKFKVTSESNPEVSQEVSVTFKYKTPLEKVSSQETYEMSVGDSIDPELTFTPSDATETRFNWTYSQDGIVQVKETVNLVNLDHYISRKIIALANGTVTVTGTPLDDSKGCEPVVFTVTVNGSGQTENVDYLKMAKEDIAHGLEYLQNQSQASYGNEWTIFTSLRAGGFIDAQQRIIYLQSVADEMKNNAENKQPTDYARLVLTLQLLDVDPENFEGINLVEKLYNNTTLENQTSNQICWTLLALDSRKYDIPENALWNRDKLIEKILTFQAPDGSFALNADESGDVDMTGMILQALAPYYNSSFPQVQSAVNKALEYLKGQMNENLGYISGGAENSCTAAQVLTALAALKIDPTDAANGFTLGTKNLITNLHSFKQDSGFAYLLGEGTNLMGTQQTTYAIEAYRRYAESENSLYDLTDLDEETETVTYEVTLPAGDGYTAEAADGSQSPVAKGGRYVFTVTLADGYTKGEDFAVKVNGSLLTESEGKYTISHITSDQNITVEGVRIALVGEKFSVSLPSGEGYTAAPADGAQSPVDYGGSYGFTVTIAEGYEKTDEFAVKANGTTLTEKDGKYTIDNIRDNQTVTVTGVKQKVGTIKVRFSLLGCYKHDDGETAVHTLADGNLQAWVEAKEYEVPADSTVKDVLEIVLSQNGMSCSNPTENYVKSIKKNGEELGEFSNGNLSGWMFTINGVHGNLGVSEQYMKDGDVIVFHYTDDYTVEYENDDHDDSMTDIADVADIYKETGDYLAALGTPNVGSIGGEWMALGLARSGRAVPSGYYENVAAYVKENINRDNQLHKAKSTDNSRVILALTACGYDPRDVEGYNLLQGLTDLDYVKKQGINGPIWALIAFDSHDYDDPSSDSKDSVTREKLIDTILAAQLTDGGWTLSGNAADADMTGMALQALAPYYNVNDNVKAAVDKAVAKLSVMQDADGSFGSADVKNSESCAQVIVALTALGINPHTDSRFVKNERSVVDALCAFAVDDGGFAHILGGERNGMATEQGYYALTAYMRFLEDKTSLYDMSDVTLKEGSVSDADTTNKKDQEAAEAVEDLIDAIGKVTVNSGLKIQNARTAYDKLTAAQKKLVGNYAELTAAEADYDEAKAEHVEDLIDAIGTVTVNSETRIKKARNAYNNLTSAQKKMVGNYDDLKDAEEALEEAKVEHVEDLIDSIGTVTLNSKTKISRARTAYNNLSISNKKEVSNLDVLVAAEAAYAELLAASKTTTKKASTSTIKRTVVSTERTEISVIAEKVKGMLEALDADSMAGEIYDAVLAYEELTEDEKESIEKEFLVKDLKKQIGEMNQTDIKTGIGVSGCDWSIQLIVEDVLDITLIQLMKEQLNEHQMLGLWDIYLENTLTGEKYIPQEAVLIKIPLSSLGDFSAYDGLLVVHYTDDGKVEFLNCTVIGDSLVFNTNDFSNYAVIGYHGKSPIEGLMTGNTSTDSTPEMNTSWIPWTVCGICGLVIIALLVVLMKKNSKNV